MWQRETNLHLFPDHGSVETKGNDSEHLDDGSWFFWVVWAKVNVGCWWFLHCESWNRTFVSKREYTFIWLSESLRIFKTRGSWPCGCSSVNTCWMLVVLTFYEVHSLFSSDFPHYFHDRFSQALVWLKYKEEKNKNRWRTMKIRHEKLIRCIYCY